MFGTKGEAGPAIGSESKGEVETEDLNGPATGIGRVMGVAKGTVIGERIPVMTSAREERVDTGGTRGEISDSGSVGIGGRKGGEGGGSGSGREESEP